MHFYKDEKSALFIDGANFYGVSKTLDFDVDYKRLLQWAQSCGQLVRASYYTTLIEDAEFSPLRPLIDWLDYNGFNVVTKKSREFDNENGGKKYKGSIEVDLAVDAMKLADQVDHIILFTGDGDYTPLVKGLQDKGVRVSIVSSLETKPSMVADDLRRQADQFIEILDIIDFFERASDDEGLQKIVNG